MGANNFDFFKNPEFEKLKQMNTSNSSFEQLKQKMHEQSKQDGEKGHEALVGIGAAIGTFGGPAGAAIGAVAGYVIGRFVKWDKWF